MDNQLVRIPPAYRRAIESSLGRPVEIGDKESILDLRNISLSTLSDLKKITEEKDYIFAERYLRYLTPKETHRYLMDFFSDVVLGTSAAKNWLRTSIVYLGNL